jgi:hypothetical protein
MFAFVINHFGDNKNYLRPELYFFFNLRKNTNHDIIYLHSIDTPQSFVDAIYSLNLNIKCVQYDDSKMTNIIYKSVYNKFNILRTCNFIFAYKLKKYEKVCILEADMIIESNIDDIFNLQTPSILCYGLNNNDILTNKEIIPTEKDVYNVLNGIPSDIDTNGGVILLKPSKSTFKKLKKTLKLIIKKECMFPNEALFLCTIKKYYNLPIMYNMSHFFIKKYKITEPIKIIHYNNTQYKPLFIIEDKTFDINNINTKIKKNNIMKLKKIYDQHYNFIENIFKSIQ